MLNPANVKKQRHRIEYSLDCLKGRAYRGVDLERMINRHFPDTEWKLCDNTVDCSGIKNDAKLYYIHVDTPVGVYADIECHINNHNADSRDWVVMVKNIFRT